MGYEEEMAQLVEALEAAGYVGIPNSAPNPYLPEMKKQVGSRPIVVFVGNERGITPSVDHSIPLQLYACFAKKTVSTSIQVSALGTGNNFDKIIADLEARLPASE